MFVCCYWLCFVVVVDVCFWVFLDGGCGVSSPGFFSNSGVTIACLNWGATIPVEREALTINVINETRASRHCLVRKVGIGSSMQLFIGDFKMSSRISSSVTGSN